MEKTHVNVISEVRNFSRFYTNILGLLDQSILDSPYSLTEVRILFEINKINKCTANTLIDKLGVDKGYLSRILNRLKLNGLITKEKCCNDARSNFLKLTAKGNQLLINLSKKSDIQVENLINHLKDDEKEKLVDSMKYIIKSLSDNKKLFKIRTYKPNDINYIIKKHREIYKDEFGFSHVFGDYVEKYLTKFDRSHDVDKENIWIAEENNKSVGIIAITRIDNLTAQLRWFLIEQEMRNKGLGHILLNTALNFCKEKNYNHIILWTADVLKAARYLYKSYGFNLTESINNTTWTDHLIKEERWELRL